VSLGAAFPWRGEAGAALGGGARPTVVAAPASVREEGEGAVGLVGPKRPSGSAASEEEKWKNAWVCYGCWAEYRKRIGKSVFFLFLAAEMGEFKWKFEF
jgi:hypothetical protein